MSTLPTDRTRETTTLASHIARFAEQTTASNLPSAVLEKARLHLMDTLGLALASHTQDFSGPSLAGVKAVGSAGPCTVIGTKDGLTHRDAALANGILMHGLDFDDTHLSSIIHASVASLPAALAVAEHTGQSWLDMITAYAIGMETAIRIGAAVQGGFHKTGFHATGVVSHFSSAVVAAKLLQLSAAQIVSAQGVAGSTASGVQVFLEEGAWTKRMHPGWGAVAGITAAYLVKSGFKAPSRPYEGRFGVFEAYLHGLAVDHAFLGEGIGEQWMMLETAIKPYPICHFSHGCAEAASQLHEAVAGKIDKIRCVTAFLPEPTMHIVAEPADEKVNVNTDYEAKFSVQYVTAAALLRGHFGMKELEPGSIADPRIRELTRKVTCKVDPDSQFPKYFSGNVEVQFHDGTSVRAEVPINKGVASREMTRSDIEHKFMSNATMRVTQDLAEQLLEALNRNDNRPVSQVMACFRL